jgi:uncharacterized protein YjbJ (UPF0337 family)
MSTTAAPVKPNDSTTQPGQATQTLPPKQQQAEQAQKPQSAPVQQVKPTLTNVETIKEKWKQIRTAAKARWVKLSEDELTKTDGDEQKLTNLVKNRYVISQDDANKQVKSFLAKNSSK